MGAVLTKLLEVFWTKKLDIVVIGLENRCVSNSVCVLLIDCVVSTRLARRMEHGVLTSLSFLRLYPSSFLPNHWN